MKKLENLKGVNTLNRMEQKRINGGGNPKPCSITCGDGTTIFGGPECPNHATIREICGEDGNNGDMTESCICPSTNY